MSKGCVFTYLVVMLILLLLLSLLIVNNANAQTGYWECTTYSPYVTTCLAHDNMCSGYWCDSVSFQVGATIPLYGQWSPMNADKFGVWAFRYGWRQ